MTHFGYNQHILGPKPFDGLAQGPFSPGFLTRKALFDKIDFT